QPHGRPAWRFASVASLFFFPWAFSLGPKRPPVAIYGKFRRGGINGNPQSWPARRIGGALVPASFRGAIATKQSRFLREPPWIASLALAMTQAALSSRHVMSEFCPRPRTK